MTTDAYKLDVWKEAHEYTLDVYKITEKYPKQEQYGLISQMRRAASSVPCNIVKGKGRGSVNEFRKFLRIARASLMEVRYQMMLSKDLGYIKENEFRVMDTKADTINRKINGLISKLR